MFKIAIIFWVAIALSACGGPEERKAKYRARAQEYLQAGNFPKARVALRNVLKIDPKDADAYYLFAQVEEKEKNWRNAVKLYQEVVQLVPNHAGALITLGKYYLEARLTDHVIETADKVLAKDPRHPQATALKIAVLSTEDKIPEAISKAEVLASQFPTEPDVAILLATLYSQQHRYHDAESTLRRALQTHPRDMDLLNNLNTTLVQAKDIAGAENTARHMMEAEPTVFDHRLRLARLYDEHGAYEKAEAVLREAVALDPDNEQRRLVLADFLTMRKDVQTGEAALLEAAQHLPHSTKIQFGLAALYERSRQDSKVGAIYQTLVKEYKTKPAGLEAKVRLAGLDLVAGKQEEAERQVHEVLKDNPRSSDALVLLGKMALARRNGKDAVQAFRTVLRDQPELASVQFLLGQAYLLTGETNLARDSFERAVALYPGQVDARRSLAALESQSGQHQRARARLEDLLKQRPDDVTALEMLFNLDLIVRNWTQAQATLARLRAASGSSYVALMAEGRFYETQRQLDKAGAVYERATAAAPNAPDALLALVKLEVAQGHTDRAQTRLEALLATRPDHLFGHGLLGEVLTLTGHPGEADSHFREATRVNPKWITPWLDWATLWLSQQKPDVALQVLKSGLGFNQESEELHMLLATAYSDQGQIDSAVTAYDAVLHLNPRNVLAANNLAVLLADYKGDAPSLEKAFSLSRDFEKSAPHPLFLDTLGWVRFKMGHQDEALRLIQQAASQAPEQPALNYHLGIALYKTGNTEKAKTHLTKALKTGQSFHGRADAEKVLSQLRG